MLEATVDYLGGVKFEAAARGHRVISDQPLDNQGTDAGMAPPEFLLVSLGTCAAFYVAQYLRARSLDAAGLRVQVTAEKAANPARIGSFRVQITAPGVNEERHREGVLRAARSCLIHHTLLQPPSIEMEIKTL